MRLSIYITERFIIDGIRLTVINFLSNIILLSRLLLPFLREFIKHVNSYKVGHRGVHLVSFQELKGRIRIIHAVILLVTVWRVLRAFSHVVKVDVGLGFLSIRVIV
jgi:hypothetical protein